jgi:hypothetical protein
MSVEVATWVTAVATVVLAVFAVITAWYAREAFRKQAQEVGLLLEQNKREEEERRRAQAVQVHLWRGPVLGEIDGPYFAELHLRNTSPQPIYYPRFGWDMNGRLVAFILHAGQVMPRRSIEVNLMQPTGTLPNQDRLDPVAVFRDRAGIWWAARADGRLDELPEPPPLLFEAGPTGETAPDAGLLVEDG